MSIYICSDIHGQYTLFMKMLQDIGFSSKDKMFILGDIIDRGPKSIRLLKYIMSQDNIVCLLGNHEHLMWYNEIEYHSEYSGVWLLDGNGGMKTKKQLDRLSKKEQEQIFEYIKNMYLQVEIEVNKQKYLLSHSCFLFRSDTLKWHSLNRRDVSKVVWNSPWRFWEYTPFEYYEGDGRTHIIGHVPVQKIFVDEYEHEIRDEDALIKKANKIEPVIEHSIINIDGGCAYRSKNIFSKAGLICMNLTKYANGEENAFTYYNK